MKRLFITLLVLAALLGVADVLARLAVESAVAKAVSEQVDAASTDVRVDGFPILWHLARGGVPQVSFHLRDLVVGQPPIELGSVRVVLERVRVSWGELIRRDARQVDVDDGRFEVRVGQDALQALVDQQRPGWVVTLEAGSARARGEVGGIAVEAVTELRLDGTDLLLLTREVTAGALGVDATVQVAGVLDFRTPLPALPYGLTFGEVVIRPGVLILRGDVPAGTIGGGPTG